MDTDSEKRWNLKKKMKTFEVRSLLTEHKREIPIPSDILKLFRIWKSKVGTEEVIQPEMVFYAGYILSNPIVKEQYFNSVKELNGN